MKRISSLAPRRRMTRPNPEAASEQRHPAVPSQQGSGKDLLLRHPNFVAKLPNARRDTIPPTCEASALTAELTALKHLSYTI